LVGRKFHDGSGGALVAVIADEGVELTAEAVQALLDDDLTQLFVCQVGNKGLELAGTTHLLAKRGFRDLWHTSLHQGDR
jgi:hypothetical protein